MHAIQHHLINATSYQAFLNRNNDVDISIEILGKNRSTNIFITDTRKIQRLFRYEERGLLEKALEEFNTYFGISSLATVGIEGELRVRNLGAQDVSIICT